MTPQQQAAMRQALEALEDIFGKNKVDVGAINALRQALEQQEKPEPVECERCDELAADKGTYFRLYEAACIELQALKKQAKFHQNWQEIDCPACGFEGAKAFLKPAAWVGLTDEEIDQGLCRTNYAMQTAGAWRDGVEWAMNQLKEKNT